MLSAYPTLHRVIAGCRPLWPAANCVSDNILHHTAEKIKRFSRDMVCIATLGYPASTILPPWVVPTAILFDHRPCVEQIEGLQGECDQHCQSRLKRV